MHEGEPVAPLRRDTKENMNTTESTVKQSTVKKILGNIGTTFMAVLPILMFIVGIKLTTNLHVETCEKAGVVLMGGKAYECKVKP